MKLLIDMNLSRDWVFFLSDAGLEALHWSLVGSPKSPASEMMTYARENGWVVFSF